MEESYSRLPFRVKGGQLNEEKLCLETSQGISEVPWEKIKLLALGIIENKVGMGEVPKSFLRSVLSSAVFGEKLNEDPQVKSVQRTYLLDIFVEGEDKPYRLDSAYINYRAFLPKVSHISARNFKSLLKLFCLNARQCRLDLGLLAFLKPSPGQVKTFASVYDYELELENIKKNPALQMPQCEIEIETFLERKVCEDEPEDF